MQGTLARAVAAGSLIFAACVEPAALPSEPFEPAFAPGGVPFSPSGPQQPVVDMTRGFNYAIAASGVGQLLAQTFTADRTELLGYIELPVACEIDVLLDVKIRQGLAGPILYEIVYLAPPPPAEGGLELIQVYDATVSRGIRLRKGTVYAIELAAVTSDPNIADPRCSIVPGPAGDPYPGGQAWFLSSDLPGADWTAFAGGEDLPFITWVR